MLNKLKCYLGLHKYTIELKSRFEDEQANSAVSMNYMNNPSYNYCSNCRTWFRKEFYCLGTRPIEHMKYYQPLKGKASINPLNYREVIYD